MKDNWGELVTQQERSAMMPTEFCRARSIDPSNFGYQRWRRRGAQTKERFVRVDGGAIIHVEIVLRDGVTIRAPLSAMKEALEALDAAGS
jgi:hypothetical protein